MIEDAKKEQSKVMDDYKKRDLDMAAANKILKRQYEQNKSQLKTKDKEIE